MSIKRLAPAALAASAWERQSCGLPQIAKSSRQIVEQAELLHEFDVGFAGPCAVAPAQFQQRLPQRFRNAARFQVLVADDVTGQEREHRAYFRARGVAVLIAVECSDLPDLDLFRGPARILGAGEDLRLRIVNIVGRQAIVSEYAIGGLPRRLQGLGVRGGEKDRRRAFDPWQMRACRAEGCRRARQQRLDERDSFRQILGARLRESDVLGAAVAGADAEHGATVGDVIERGDRGRAHRRMTGQQIGDANSHSRALGGARDQRGRHPRIHRIAGRVGDADHRIAVAVRALGKLFAEIEVVRPEEETNLHLALFLGVEFRIAAASDA